MSVETTSYTHRVELALPYEEAVDRARAALKEQGFGVLTEIDMKEKLQEKLGVDFQRYVILGACNPPLAHRALQSEIEVGVLLPCNVVVYETGEGRSTVAAMAPKAAMAAVSGSPALEEVAAEADALLQKALQNLENS